MKVVHAIVLKIIPYNDTQKIVRVFSKERGYLSFISPSFVFKQKKILFHVMQAIEIEYFENPVSDIHKLKSISSLMLASQLYANIFKMNIALLWAEVLDILLRKEEKNELLYDFVLHSVNYLNESVSDIANFNLFFFYHLAGYIGFKINTETYEEGRFFNINDGCFVAEDQGEPYISGQNTAKIIYRICVSEVGGIGKIPLNRESRRILLDIILLFFSIHLRVDFDIKSIKVIREIFE